MNKLTLAACAAICATSVIAADQITSANVVGYATKTTDKAGFSVFTPMFQNVDATKQYSIQDIVPVSGFGGWMQEYIQVLDKDGNVSERFVWLNETMATACGGPVGWYTTSTPAVLADREIANGESFLISNPSTTGYALQFAGQVNYSSTAISSEGGFIVIGNATPVSMDIQKFAPVSGFEGWMQEYIQILDEDGNVAERYVWLNDTMASAMGGTRGWYTVTEPMTYATRIFAAGEGFLISTPKAMTITIPAVAK